MQKKTTGRMGTPGLWSLVGQRVRGTEGEVGTSPWFQELSFLFSSICSSMLIVLPFLTSSLVGELNEFLCSPYLTLNVLVV